MFDLVDTLTNALLHKHPLDMRDRVRDKVRDKVPDKARDKLLDKQLSGKLSGGLSGILGPPTCPEVCPGFVRVSSLSRAAFRAVSAKVSERFVPRTVSECPLPSGFRVVLSV